MTGTVVVRGPSWASEFLCTAAGYAWLGIAAPVAVRELSASKFSSIRSSSTQVDC